MTPLQVVVVNWRDLPHPLAGGSEVLVDRLLRELAGRGHDVALVCGGPIGAHPYPTTDAGGTYAQYLRAPLICARRYRAADVVIDAQNGLPFFSPLWRRGASVCLVHHVHTDQWATRFPEPVASALARVEKTVMPAVYRDRLFAAISRSTADSLAEIGVDRSRIRLVESGVDIPEGPLPAKSADPLVVAVSRLVPHKRIDLLLDAWALAQPVTGGRLVVMGDGPELARLRAQAAGIKGAEMAGHVTEEEKLRLLGSAWMLVHSAHHEGWGMAVLEAAAVGTPAVAFDVVGVRDAVVDGVTGVLVPDSSPDRSGAGGAGTPVAMAATLAAAIAELALDDERRHRLGARARQRAEDLQWSRSVDRWEEIITEAYERAADRHRGRAWRIGGRRESRQPLGPLGPVARGTGRGGGNGTAGHSEAGGAGRGGTMAAAPRPAGRAGGLTRSLELFKGFRTQFDDPDGFYTLLADDTVDLVQRRHRVAGQRVVDVGGGPGYFAEGFRRAGARSVFIEPDWDEMTAPGRALGFGVCGDGLALPFGDATFDISHSSNVIEHVAQPGVLLDELVRVVRPGGTIFLAFTNWLSPFGGHETSPWHLLVGGERAALRYQRRTGAPPKNRYGRSLYRLSISAVLSMVAQRTSVELLEAFPRYYPGWTRPLVALPGVREVMTWNLALMMRRR